LRGKDRQTTEEILVQAHREGGYNLHRPKKDFQSQVRSDFPWRRRGPAGNQRNRNSPKRVTAVGHEPGHGFRHQKESFNVN